MTEKISGQGIRPADAGNARAAEKAGSAGGRTVARAPTSSGDTVNVERSELLLSRLDEALRNSPVVDAGRVQALKAAIASGAYEVDPVAIAEKILRLEREIAGR